MKIFHLSQNENDQTPSNIDSQNIFYFMAVLKLDLKERIFRYL